MNKVIFSIFCTLILTNVVLGIPNDPFDQIIQEIDVLSIENSKVLFSQINDNETKNKALLYALEKLVSYKKEVNGGRLVYLLGTAASFILGSGISIIKNIPWNKKFTLHTSYASYSNIEVEEMLSKWCSAVLYRRPNPNSKNQSNYRTSYNKKYMTEIDRHLIANKICIDSETQYYATIDEMPIWKIIDYEDETTRILKNPNSNWLSNIIDKDSLESENEKLSALYEAYDSKITELNKKSLSGYGLSNEYWDISIIDRKFFLNFENILYMKEMREKYEATLNKLETASKIGFTSAALITIISYIITQILTLKKYQRLLAIIKELLKNSNFEINEEVQNKIKALNLESSLKS